MTVCRWKDHAFQQVIAAGILVLACFQFIQLVRLSRPEKVVVAALPMVVTSAATTTLSTAATAAPSDYAYAFVVGGCHPDAPVYRVYIYNILVACRVLRQQGSTQDIVVFVQMDATSVAPSLPAQEVAWLQQAGVSKIVQLPQPEQASFFQLQMSKFHILGLVEYKRVLYMDSDVMPLANLDYLFHWSDPSAFAATAVDANANDANANATTPTVDDNHHHDTVRLEENVVVAGKLEPANGGFFVLTPGRDKLAAVQALLDQRHAQAQTMAKPHYFDAVTGWGHAFDTDSDMWRSNKLVGDQWDFHAAFCDQGLLYYYTKYHQQAVSIFFADRLENWSRRPEHENGSTNSSSSLVLETVYYHNHTSMFDDVQQQQHGTTPRLQVQRRFCRKATLLEDPNACPPPYADYVHFSGSAKPWFPGPPDDLNEINRLDSEIHYWWWTLYQLDAELDMQKRDLFDHWVRPRHPLAGAYPKHRQVLQPPINLSVFL